MHEIRSDETHSADGRVVLDGALAVGRAANGPLFRLHLGPDGDAIVIAACDATRDGMPMTGRLAVVRRGASALVRAADLRLEIVWEERGGAATAVGGERCRMCFGVLSAGERAVRCRCEARFHLECDGVRVSCPACGDPGEGGAR